MEWTRILDQAPGRYGLYAKNLHTGAVVAYHEKEIFPSASLIKVPIMVEVFRRFEEANQSLDELLPMRAEDQVGGSGVLKDLTPGTRYCIRDLTTLMITVSDNTATNLLIDFLGVDSVNLTLARLGLRDTELVRKLQRVPAERSTFNRTTAWDMATLMERLATGTAIAQAASERMIALLTRCQGPISIGPAPLEPAWPGQPPRIVIAHKTGSLTDARHDAGIVYLPRQAYVAAILSQGAPGAKLAGTLAKVGRMLPRWLG